MKHEKKGFIVIKLCLLVILIFSCTHALAEREKDTQSGFWQNTNLPEGTQIVDLKKSLQGETYGRLNTQWILVVDPNTLVVPDIQNQDRPNALFFIDSDNGKLLRKVPIDNRGSLISTLWIDEGAVVCRFFLDDDDRSELMVSARPTGEVTYETLQGNERSIYWLNLQKTSILAEDESLYLFNAQSGKKTLLLKGIPETEEGTSKGKVIYYDFFAPLTEDSFIYEANDGWPSGYLGYGIFNTKNMQATALSSIGCPKTVIGRSLYATNGITNLETLSFVPYDRELGRLVEEVDNEEFAGWEVSPEGTRIAAYRSSIYLDSPMNGLRIFDPFTGKEIFSHTFDDLITIVRLSFLDEKHLVASCQSFKMGVDVNPVVLIIPIP